jgi:uncharacterized protein
VPNPFAHIELTTDDLKAAKKFYTKLFDWKLTEVPGMNYVMIDVGNGTGGGMQLPPMPGAPKAWMPYVQVDDVAVTVKKAVRAGGVAILPFQSVGKMGSIGVIADPSGSLIGVWAPAPPTSKASAKPRAAKVTKATAKKSPKEAPPAKPSKASSPRKDAVAAKAPSKKRSSKK